MRALHAAGHQGARQHSSSRAIACVNALLEGIRQPARTPSHEEEGDPLAARNEKAKPAQGFKEGCSTQRKYCSRHNVLAQNMDYQYGLQEDEEATAAYDKAMGNDITAAIEVEQFGFDNPADAKYKRKT